MMTNSLIEESERERTNKVVGEVKEGGNWCENNAIQGLKVDHFLLITFIAFRGDFKRRPSNHVLLAIREREINFDSNYASN
jgi:hypothetical protein